jgi:beta propeller repeat protein
MRLIIAIIVIVAVLSALIPPVLASDVWEVFPIATGAFNESDPAISGDIVVWNDNRNGESDIYGYDLATAETFPVCVADGTQVLPSVSGNIIVWQDHRNGDPWGIYGYDLSTGQEFVVSEDAGPTLPSPEVSGAWVVWVEYRSEAGGYGVYARNLLTQQEKTLHVGDDELAGGLQLRNDVAVWYEYCGIDRRFDILGYDLATDSPLTLCSNPEYQYYPSTDGTTVVWQDRRKGVSYDMDIYGLDLETGIEFAVDTSSTDTRDPAVQGDLVIWIADRNLYGHYLSTGETFLVAEDVRAQHPRICGDYIVWTASSSTGGEFDIYGARLIPEPGTLTLLVICVPILLGLAVQRRKR